MAISSMGMGSGLDIRSIVSQLLAAERAPAAQRLGRREQQAQTELSAYGTLKSALSSFQNSLQKLQDVNSFGQMKASASGEAIGVSASTKATAGSYDMSVSNLAQAQSLASAAFDSRDEILGGGSLVFRFGEVEMTAGEVSGFNPNADVANRTVEIAAGATLTQVRDAVNNADFGVQASIINDGNGERLVFSSKNSGAENGFVIDVQDNDGDNLDTEGLSRLAFNQNATNIVQNRAAEDAVLEINGLEVRRPTNRINDAIDGLTLNLKELTTSDVRVDVTRDTASVKGRVLAFVDSFNSLQKRITELTQYNPETEKAGPLNGNALVRGMSSQLRNLLVNPVNVLEGGDIRALSDLGILTKRDGTLEFDHGRMDKALEDNFEQVAALFSSKALTGDTLNVEFLKSSSATKPGNYQVNITQAATQGQYQGDAVAGPFEIDGTNNSFKLSVDGVKSKLISLTQDTYADGAAMAVEMQAQINADSAFKDKGITVAVQYVDGAFAITSSSYGSESTVEVTTANAYLGLVLGEGDAGVDVAGTINGIEAEGKGRELIGKEGSNIEGLKLLISGDELGDRGVLTFSRGILPEIDGFMDRYLKSNGIIDGTTKSLNNRIDEVARGREQLDRRMKSVEARLIAQFTAMDAMVGQMQAQGDFLSQQLANLPGPRKSGGK